MRKVIGCFMLSVPLIMLIIFSMCLIGIYSSFLLFVSVVIGVVAMHLGVWLLDGGLK